jgi:hypothetical protein
MAAYHRDWHRPGRVLLSSFARTWPDDERSTTAMMFVLDDLNAGNDWEELRAQLKAFEADPRLRARLEAQSDMK